MNSFNRTVIESNIPVAQDEYNFGNGLTTKQRREQEDITAWLELQEDAEIELLMSEYTCKAHRSFRHDDVWAYD
jgi:hypothetical protein